MRLREYLGPTETSLAYNRYASYSDDLRLLNYVRSIPGKTYATSIIWLNNMPVAQLGDEGFIPTTVLRYTFTDHLGTPILQMVDSDVVWQAEYEPFGRIFTMRTGDAAEQILRLPGQEAVYGDEASSYNIFRWYRPEWSRYTQADPIGINGGLNLYAYVDGNPVAMIDPVGLKKTCCTEGPDKLWKDVKKAKKTSDELLKGMGHGGVPTAATYCGGGDLPPGQPMSAFFPPYKKLGPCEQACTQAHEGSHASLCKQFGFKALSMYQTNPANWAKDEALAYLVEANCLAGAANNGFVDVDKDYPDAPKP